MIELLDYILDNDDNFWIVNNITNSVAKGYIVYRVSREGKINHITKKKYIKDNDNNGIMNVPTTYKMIFKPRNFYKEHKRDLEGIWKSYVLALNEIGIGDDDIGIFGSYLIGFDIEKDVDFVIYKRSNLDRYYKNIDYIKKKCNVTSITKEHIEYQYNKHKVKFNNECDLMEIISRNWSGIELSNGVLSTPRFIDINKMSIPLKKGKDKVIKIKVKEGLTSAMLPRIAKVEYNKEEYVIYSTLWKFQSFAHANDVLEVFANVDEKNKIIIIDECKYYIKYIKKSNKIA